MGKKYKVDYFSGDGIIEIIVRDPTGRKEASFTCNQSDGKSISKVGAILLSKYGIDFSPKKGFFEE